MPTLDWAFYPQIFDTVIDYLVDTGDTLRAIALTSRSAYSTAFRKCSGHMVFDYRNTYAKVATSLGRLPALNAELLLKAAPGTYDVHCEGPEASRRHSRASLHRFMKRSPPQVMRLLTHAECEPHECLPPKCKTEVDTVIYHTRNTNDAGHDFWSFVIPAYAKRIVVNFISASAWGYPDVFIQGIDGPHRDADLEWVYIFSSPPRKPRSKKMKMDAFEFLDVTSKGIVTFLNEDPQYTAVLVGTAAWEAEMKDFHEFLEGRDLVPAGMGQVVFADFVDDDELLSRIEFVTHDEYRKRVGESLYRLMTEE